MSAFTPRLLLEALRRLPGCQRYWVAYSGGRDSHVLLHALASQRQELATDIQVVYVDHGLHSLSSQWLLHCQAVCVELNLPFSSRCVDARPKAGQSPEAAARQARYAVFAGLLGKGDILLTGQHQDDQAETLMLQLLRGAGPHGLAAMPECKRLGPGLLARPLLAFSRAELDHYGHCHGLQWIDDPSNDDHRFKRNYLRHQVLPRIQEQWPAFAKTLSRSARLSADAAELLDQLAAQDMATLAMKVAMNDGLSVAGMRSLDPVRQRNVLRYWCASKELPTPGQVHIHQIQQQMFAAADSTPLVCWSGVELRRYQGCLMLMSSLPPVDNTVEKNWDMTQTLSLAQGHFSAIAGEMGGLAAHVRQQQVTVRFRRGGERLMMASGQHQSLKKIMQQLLIPPWQRDRLPLIYIDGELAAVAGLMVAARFAVQPGEASLRLEWVVE